MRTVCAQEFFLIFFSKMRGKNQVWKGFKKVFDVVGATWLFLRKGKNKHKEKMEKIAIFDQKILSLNSQYPSSWELIFGPMSNVFVPSNASLFDFQI